MDFVSECREGFGEQFLVVSGKFQDDSCHYQGCLFASSLWARSSAEAL